MGIKFYCPNGHKVHVKSFLAGRKGRCPKCGVQVEIPRESVLEQPVAGVPPPASEVTGGNAVPDTLAAKVRSSVPPTFSLVREQPQAVSPATEVTAPISNQANDEEPITLIDADEVPEALAPPLADDVDIAAAFSTDELSSSSAEASAAAPQESERLLPLGASGSEVAAPMAAVWYVHTATGVQAGPVTADTLQQWIAQGRVTPDALVWRNGWTDWQPLGSAFPQRRGELSPVVPGSSPGKAGDDRTLSENPLASAVEAAGSSAKVYRRGSRSKKEVRAMTSLILLVLVVILFAVLLYVFFVRDPKIKETAPQTAPTTSQLLPPWHRLC